jgi:PAS domain S-box-containing protein
MKDYALIKLIPTLKKGFYMTEKPIHGKFEQKIYMTRKKFENDTTRDTAMNSDINPKIQISDLDLESIIDTKEIQSIMDDFCSLTNMVTAILDLKGNVIEATGWQDICTKFHRINPKTACNCKESDLFLTKDIKPGEYVDYKCKNGLWDVVTPLYVGTTHLGNIYTGQFFYDDEEIDEDFFIKQADRYGFDKDAYLEAFMQVPRYSRDTIAHLMSFLVKLTTYISKIGLANIPLEKEIKERKQAQEALKERTAFLDKIIETSAVSLWISDEKGTAIRANSACLAFFGSTQEEVIGKYNLFQDSVIRKEGFMPVIKEVFEKGDPARFVINYDFGAVDHVDVKNATHKIIETVLTPVMDGNNRVSNVIVQSIDLTAIKLSEEEKTRVNKILAEHEKLSLIGQVAGKMAHDFNNVLGIIMGNTELSLLDCKDEQTKKTLALIYDQTIRGKNLTKNLVAFAKDQEPKQKFFRINEKIDLVINLLKKDLEGIELITENKPGMPDLLADPGMIEHALVNLLQNSIHATSRVESPKIMMRTYSSGDNVCFEIEDNGCGIPKEHLSHIFEPSFTLKGNKDATDSYESTIKGTGYGMSNVKKYIDLHKGAIAFESKADFGTKFTIHLPIIKKELTRGEKTELRGEMSQFEKYILIVEDEISISDIQYRVLTQEPCRHKVDIANNGQVAMDLFDRNEYDFISLDYVLLGKISGMTVYHHIRATNQTIPILFISGNIEFLESIKELKQKDVNLDHLSKPCQNKDYVKSINALLESSVLTR